MGLTWGAGGGGAKGVVDQLACEKVAVLQDPSI